MYLKRIHLSDLHSIFHICQWHKFLGHICSVFFFFTLTYFFCCLITVIHSEVSVRISLCDYKCVYCSLYISQIYAYPFWVITVESIIFNFLRIFYIFLNDQPHYHYGMFLIISNNDHGLKRDFFLIQYISNSSSTFVGVHVINIFLAFIFVYLCMICIS